ncbi:MAG TPA: shikimate dehydrogenase [Gemmatimonadales bacterium]|nr:shikimate dehydrogenase [Gemmatimonadales bacterium]
MIDGSTRVFALLGDPVAHSLSPAMQNAAFHALGLRAVYVALRCAPADLRPLMQALTRAGGGGNITVPHKEEAARSVEHESDLVTSVGACNVFWADGAGVAGDNTDVSGLLDALAPLDPPDGPWLVAGTGGGARAAAVAAARRGASIAVCSRSAERRSAFESWVRSCGIGLAAPAACRVLINATPLGLAPDDPLPPGPEAAPGAAVALDMVYGPGETRWVRAMRAAGLRAADGRGMLVGQGARALERWFPGVDAPVEVMRAAVDAALR